MPRHKRHSSYRASGAGATLIALFALSTIGAAGEERPETSNTAKPGTDAKATTDPLETADTKPLKQSDIRPTDPPPPPSLDEARGPDVTLIAGEARTVYEYRQHGKLLRIKVVPQGGKPYYLAPRDPTTGFGDLEQADTLVPRWVLIEF